MPGKEGASMSKADVIRGIYDNPPSVVGLVTPDFRIHSSGQNMISGVYTGVAEMKARFDLMDAMTRNTFEHDLAGPCLADDTWAMSVVRLRGERNGAAIDMPGFGLWRFEGERITDHWECPGDQKAWDAFWS